MGKTDFYIQELNDTIEIRGREKLGDDTCIIVSGENKNVIANKIHTLLGNNCEDYDTYFKDKGSLQEVVDKWEEYPFAIEQAEKIMEALALALANYMDFGVQAVTITQPVLDQAERAIKTAKEWKTVKRRLK